MIRDPKIGMKVVIKKLEKSKHNYLYYEVFEGHKGTIKSHFRVKGGYPLIVVAFPTSNKYMDVEVHGFNRSDLEEIIY